MEILIPAWIEAKLQPVEKLKAHQLGLRHKAVSVFVMQGEEMLLQRRALGKYHTPGLWANSCCTHPHWDEAPLDCAHRRLDEEIGLTGLTLEPRGQVEYRADVGPDMIEHEVVDIFRAQVTEKPKPRPNPQEVIDLRWITLGALKEEIAQEPARFTPWLRIYLQEHSDQLFGPQHP